MRRLKLTIGLAIAVAAAAAGAQEAAVAERPLALEPLIDAALRDNPQLRALRSRVDAAKAFVPQASALADPVVGIALSNMPVGHFAFDQTPMSGIQIMLRQKYPGKGKRSVRKLLAQDSVAISRTDYEEAEDEIIRQVKEAYYDLYFIDQGLAILLENKRLLEDIAAIAEIKTSVGRGPQHDLIKAQLAVTQILDKLLEFQKMRRSAAARLNALLDRWPDAPIGTPLWEGLHRYTLSVDALREVAEEDRPMLVGMRKMVEMAKRKVRLAELSMRPDYQAGFDYRVRAQSMMDPVAGSDFWGFSVMMSVPSWNRRPHEAEVDQAKSQLTAARRNYENMVDRVWRATEVADASLQRLAGQVELYETGLIPQAELALGSAWAAYSPGRVDMLTFLSAQVALQNLQLNHLKALVDYEKGLAELEEITGDRLY